MFILHCLECDTYIGHAGYCPACGKGNFFTDEEVDQALSGRPVPCGRCKEPYIPPHWHPANAVFTLTGTITPGLAVRLDMPGETLLVERARQALRPDPAALLGVYHASTAYRILAARRHLQRLLELDPPFAIVAHNYRPMGAGTERQGVDFELEVFDYLMNARSAADTLAHEATVVMRAVMPSANLPDLADPNAAPRLDFFNALRGVSNRPVCRLFVETREMAWFTRLHDLRRVSFHRQVLLQQASGTYEARKLRGIRPVQLEPESVEARLPDEPAADEVTYSEHPEVRQDLGAIQDKLEVLIDSAYKLLAAELESLQE